MAKFDLLLIWLYPPPLGGWVTDWLYDWTDKMVHVAPSRCCVVVGGDLSAHVGYVRHPEREALDLEREAMAGCGEYHLVETNYSGERLAKFCQDQHMVMMNTHYPRGGTTNWNALGGREVESRLDYTLHPATWLQLVKHCFVLRKEGRRLQLIPHQRPRDHWPLMIPSKTGATCMEESTRFRRMQCCETLMRSRPALRDPARRLSLLQEVEDWSSAHADTILELAAQGRIEKAWAKMADALHQMARARFQRTSSTVPRSENRPFVDVKLSAIDKLAERRWRRRARWAHCWPWHGQLGWRCTNYDLRPHVFAFWHRQQHCHNGPQLCCELQEAWGAKRSLTCVALGSAAGR